ncbi:MAG TPA: c-type cytochrome [Blastocatellia bacterium]|nr:c-type cytochrome [Blastocatellia bacterium]
MYSKDAIKIYLLGAVMLFVTGFVFWDHAAPEWQGYQRDFRAMVTKKFGATRAEQVPGGLQQVWAPELGRVDRCTTCHQGVEWKGLEGAPNPFKSHPQEILKSHPIDQFGCSSCHGGQGYATEVRAAHGRVEHWEEPLLGKRLSDLYLVKDRKALMQINCNGCHRYDRETKGADFINEAKKIVQEKNCRACHTINGRGGVIGPDLTFEGDKSPEQFDYGRVGGVKSAFAWHVAHFQNPRALAPDSIMPDFNFSSREAQALALLVMSWKRASPPTRFIPGATPKDRPTEAELEKERQMLAGEGAFFVKKGCFICHSVNSLGIDTAAKIGPDLSDAVADVQSRFGRTLEDFLKNPTGTMSVVLSTQIQLTDEEKREAVEKLKTAYQRKQEQHQTQKAGQPPQTKR